MIFTEPMLFCFLPCRKELSSRCTYYRYAEEMNGANLHFPDASRADLLSYVYYAAVWRPYATSLKQIQFCNVGTVLTTQHDRLSLHLCTSLYTGWAVGTGQLLSSEYKTGGGSEFQGHAMQSSAVPTE
jgi:hypothetical protein